MNKLREILSERFYSLGGKIDDEESFIGIGEPYNYNVINTLLSEIIDLKKTNNALYLSFLSLLVTDSLAFLSIDNALGWGFMDFLKDGLDTIADNSKLEEIKEENYNQVIFKMIESAKDVQEFDELLTKHNLYKGLKYLIVTSIDVAIENDLEDIHFEALEEPRNIEIFRKFNTKKTFNRIFFDATKFQSKKDSKIWLIGFLRNIYNYYKRNAYAQKRAYAFHNYFIQYFSEDLGDKYYFEIVRNLYSSIKRKELENKLDFDSSIIEKLENPDYKINDIKKALTGPNIPELFKEFLTYAQDTYNEKFGAKKEINDELDKHLEIFDKRFEPISFQKRKK